MAIARMCLLCHKTLQNLRQSPPQYSAIAFTRIRAKDNISLEIGVEKGGDATLTVYNAQGGLQVSRSYKVTEGSQSFTLNCGDWSTGLYFVHLKLNGSEVMERVLIER